MTLPVPQQSKMIELIKAQTNLTDLARVAAECYQLTITAERDMAEIETRYKMASELNASIHEEVMDELEREHAKRERDADRAERLASKFLENGQFEMAFAITSQIIEAQKGSVLETAYKAVEKRVPR